MSDELKMTGVITTGITVAVLAILAASAHGCAISNESYSRAMSECAKAGGSFFPIRGAAGAEYQCLILKGN